MCLSSPTYCNCSFTIECLNNSLQILCIYAELLNSAVCCSFFFFFGAFGVSGGSQTVTASAYRPPGPAELSAANHFPSALCGETKGLPRDAAEPAAAPSAPVYLCIAAETRSGGVRGDVPSPAGRASLSGLPGVNPNPVPFCQKTRNAQNWHLISSPGFVGLCDSNSRPPGCPFHEGGGWLGRVPPSPLQASPALCRGGGDRPG